MTCLTNFFNKRLWLTVVLPALLITGCAHLDQQAVLTMDFFAVEQEHSSPIGLPVIRWKAAVSGGRGRISYEFRSRMQSVEMLEQRGSSPVWEWMPAKPGIYEVMVLARDEAGNEVDSGWSAPFYVDQPISRKSTIAVLPLENLSGEKAPLEQISSVMIKKLEDLGFHLLADERLETFRRRHRMRYVGGINSKLSQAMRDEAGVDACLITSLEAYQEKYPPQVALIARLVQTGREPAIVWMDSVGMTGEDAPGLLGLGRIKNPEKLAARAAGRLIDSLSARLENVQHGDEQPFVSRSLPGNGARQLTGPQGVKRRYLPKDFFRSPAVDPGKVYRVAVVPFFDLAVRKYAGRIMALHFVKELHQRANLVVVEPGLVREELFRFRAVMAAGPSLAITDLLTSEQSLGVDLVLSGKVFDYQGEIGTAKVDFSVQVFEKYSREVVFASTTYAAGDQGVFFFNVGRVRSAHNLSDEMTRAAVTTMMSP
ncbi:MAG: hypothetical protein JXO49_01495 [Deltaproteobacteria bacterium]|nr:hypothetical protein [Candidatus Anaeroferrophillus wilburensis]MBN2888002.1 hypothetical protein [Deltaproteobacteria bacterium]